MSVLDEVELEALVFGAETETVERKASFKAHKDDICKDICAFSNDLPAYRRPGLIVVGLDPKGGQSPDFSVTEHVLQEAAQIRTDKQIYPLPTMSVRRVTLRGCDLMLIVVAPSNEPPVRFEGRVWVRVHDQRKIATRDEERMLSERRIAWDLPFDERPVSGASLGDLDVDRIRIEYLPRAIAPEILAENHRELQQQLAALQLASADGVPTSGALLLFGREPQRWLSGAYVQFVRFDGINDTTPVQNQAELRGPLLEQVRQIDATIAANVRIAVDIGTHLQEVRTPDFAVVALQQVLRNALMHRSYDANSAPIRWYWYSDRVEIWSPGGPHSPVTERNFGSPDVTAYRNPKIATALKELGVVQRFGIGLKLARDACAKEGCPPPEFDVTSDGVKVTLRSSVHQARVLVVDTRGGVSLPSMRGQGAPARIIPAASLDLDAALRRRDPAMWRSTCESVDREVGRLCRGSAGDLHVFASAPYALAVWLGACLDRHGRGRRVALYQGVPGSGTWLGLPPQGEPIREIDPFWRRIEGVTLPEGAEAVLLAIEGVIPLPLETLRLLAGRIGVKHIRRLPSLDSRPISDAAAMNGATQQLRSATRDIQHELNPVAWHVVATAPVALMVEVGRLLNSPTLRSLVVYDLDASSGRHVPVLDIMSPAWIDHS